MASLESHNPHAMDRRVVPSCHGRSGTGKFELGARDAFSKSHGSGVSVDSKRILAVRIGNDEYIMADIRLIEDSPEQLGTLVLEFFFDGELGHLKASYEGDVETQFLQSLQSSVTGCVQEYFKRKLRASMNSSLNMSSFKSQKFPDITIQPVGSSTEEAFRDAGCMLSFIAVRVRVNEETAKAIGGVVFPSFFGMPDLEAEMHSPVPKWLVGMGAATVIMGIATIFAWTRIFIQGNQYS